MDSFNGLAEEFTPMIYKIIHQLHIYKEHDLYFNVGLEALWEAQQKYIPESGCQFSTFAFTLIKGRMLNFLRKDAVWEKRNLINSEHPCFFAEQQFDQYFCGELVKNCSALLTDHQYKWLEQTYLHSKPLIEIATEENVSIAAVKSWRRGALKRLKESLAPDYLP